MRGIRDSLAFQTMVLVGLAAFCTGSVITLYFQNWIAFAGSAAAALLCLAAGILAGVQGGRAGRPHYLCPRCGYDRRGLRHGAACPECGHNAADPPRRTR